SHRHPGRGQHGRALRLHPLVCTAYNADFDGDQMAIHVPLSAEAQAEARLLMLAANNILNPKDGKPVTTPTQDMILGSYYLTIDRDGALGEGKIFKDNNEALLAYDAGEVHLQAKILVRQENGSRYGIPNGGRLETTVGRIIFNNVIPAEVGYVNETVGKKGLGKIVAKCYKLLGASATAAMLDGIKAQGYKYSTQAGFTVAFSDIIVPDAKAEILATSDKEVERIEQKYRRGLITDEERYNLVIKVWTKATKDVTDALLQNLDKFNNINMMATSGARGNNQQIRQLGGMRGLMADSTGRTIELPIKANFREGLNVQEYFISSHGARKGLTDTALRTADSGYLTRRLVDVAQEVIVREDDCCTDKGLLVEAIKNGNEVIEPLEERITGRYALEPVIHPETGEVLVGANEEITDDLAAAIQKAGIESVVIRSALTCKSRYGICRKCYGRNLATGGHVDIGEAVGIIAAQSIGEPGTQLTMRTFHTGGVAGDDITQGLPRVEELFEARKPKGQAIIAEADGVVHVQDIKNRKEITITEGDGEARVYPVPYGARMKVNSGDIVVAGQELTEGSINPHDLLRVKGPLGVQMYLLREVQKVYRLQGVDINDKHIEVMVRQMLRKVKVEDAGDTNLLPGGQVDVFEFEHENERVRAEGGQEAIGKTVLMGITKASLATDSFMSAASFQETTRVLTDAAIKGKVDPLLGLKENVILGKLIPAGTGMSRYRGIKITNDAETVEAEENIDFVE
ncbi:MAG: DNA-directed RNA polymerase subunit beta', partial [Peptococcaceae bacterium]|nr:DNA-directed RNA polymerase subunit beta' [Peptococcaceae bacterium]